MQTLPAACEWCSGLGPHVTAALPPSEHDDARGCVWENVEWASGRCGVAAPAVQVVFVGWVWTAFKRMLWPPPVQRPCASVFSTASGKVSFSDPGCAVQAATLATQRESCMLSLLAAGCGSQPGYALACTPTGCTNECGLGVELHDALEACCRKSYGEPHDGERPYSFLARAECTAASAHTNRGQTHSTAF